MAEDNSSIQVLLECSSLNNTIPYFIGEEIVCSLPDDIEVIQLNNLPETDFNKLSPPIKLLPPKKQSPPKAKRKRINSVKANAKASKIQSLITLPEPAKDSFIDFCGLKVPVKTLLQNPDIRKQLEPFIEEIIISDVSDTSDVEEIGKTQRKNVPQDAKERKQPVKPRSKKRKKSLEPTVQEGNGPFVEVLIPEADSNELIEEDIIVNLPLAIEKDAIKDTQKMYVLEEQIQLVTDSSDDEFIVDQNNGIQEKQILLKNVNDTHKSQSSNTVLKKSKNNTKDIPNNEVVVLDDVLKENVKKKDNNSDIDKVQEAPLMESDDWYYLNLANTSKLNENSIILNADDSIKEMSTKKDNEKNENNSVVEKNIQLNQVLPNQESEVEKPVRRKRKKRRRIPWSRHAIRGTRTLKNVKAQLQGKIVKGGVKNVQSETENTTAESHVIRKKAENADTLSVKEIINNAPKTSVLDKNPDLEEYISIVCPLCERKQPNESTCTKCTHCSEGLEFRCIVCGKSFDLRPDLIVHVKRKHYDTDTLTCLTCKKNFSDKNEALTHLKTCGIVPIYFCEFCMFKSKYKHNLITHIKDKHITMNNGFKCDNCGKQMPNRKSLTKHVFNECPKKVKHKCLQCSYESYDRSNVVIHIFHNHSSIRKKTS